MEEVRPVSAGTQRVSCSVSRTFQYDAAIAGCGPAGLATAIALRAKGLRVVAVDAGQPFLDKACGEGLMVDAVKTACSLGICLDSDSGARFKGIRFLEANQTIQGEFRQGSGLAIRRTTFHRKLVEAATISGVEIRWNTPLCGLGKNALLGRDTHFAAQWIIGADGLHSNVRRWAGLNRFVWNRERVGVRRHFAVQPWSDYVDVHWGNGCQCYVTPVGASEISVAFLHKNKQTDFDELLRQFPVVAKRINGAEPVSKVRGGLTALCKVRKIYRDNVALVGDAAGTVDAITGQGIGLAMKQARALADALEAGNLPEYGKRHAAIMRRSSCMAAGLTLLGECRPLRKIVFRVWAKQPTVFEKLLALHANGSAR